MAAKKTETKKAGIKESKETKKVIATVTGDRPLNVRSGKTTEDNNVTGRLMPGDKVEILSEGKIWCRIKDGYVMRQYLEF